MQKKFGNQRIAHQVGPFHDSPNFAAYWTQIEANCAAMIESGDPLSVRLGRKGLREASAARREHAAWSANQAIRDLKDAAARCDIKAARDAGDRFRAATETLGGAK